MSEFSNKLTPAQTERIVMLMEECGEVVHACGKILWHGYDSYHPDELYGDDNRQMLRKEVRDVEAIIELMVVGGDFAGTFAQPKFEVVSRKMRFTHHQPKDPSDDL